jgi:hypothetical protein
VRYKAFGAGQEARKLELDPDRENFLPDTPEFKGITAAIVIGHEMGHILLGIFGPDNGAVVENPIRVALNALEMDQSRKVGLRRGYSGLRVPTQEEVEKKNLVRKSGIKLHQLLERRLADMGITDLDERYFRSSYTFYFAGETYEVNALFLGRYMDKYYFRANDEVLAFGEADFDVTHPRIQEWLAQQRPEGRPLPWNKPLPPPLPLVEIHSK